MLYLLYNNLQLPMGLTYISILQTNNSELTHKSNIYQVILVKLLTPIQQSSISHHQHIIEYQIIFSPNSQHKEYPFTLRQWSPRGLDLLFEYRYYKLYHILLKLKRTLVRVLPFENLYPLYRTAQRMVDLVQCVHLYQFVLRT